MHGALPYLALSMGLMSSLHCISMCGPIAMALPTQRGSSIRQFTGLITYNGGRTLTYAMLGLVSGSIGSSFAWLGYLRYLSVLSGVLMLAYVCWPGRLIIYFHPPLFWRNFIQQIKKSMARVLRARSMQSLFLLGTLNGLLPCGLVYLALISSIASGSTLNGSFFMLMFGMGTLPAMMAVGFFRQWFSVSLRSRMRKLTPVILAIAGILLIVRGLETKYPVEHNRQTSTITICHGR